MHVLVALSGGVDSSVVASLMLEAGHQVTAFIFMVDQDSNAKVAIAVKDAKRIADSLGIPLLSANLSAQFKNEVIEPFIQNYAHGLTPNPCTLCNPRFKFKVLLEKAQEIGADVVATGHYAQITHDSHGLAHLCQGTDSKKDQSYFLCNLRQDQLKKIIFPLGQFNKTEIRKMALERGIPVAEKPDSQEICFIANDDYAHFIKENYPQSLKAGNVIDLSGNVFFQHEAIQFYTIGQRKGIGAHTKRKYVVKIDPDTNNVVIGDDEDLMSSTLSLENINWIIEPTTQSFKAGAKIRSTSPPQACTVEIVEDGLKVIFDQPQRAITPGQAGAIYIGNELIAGGTIKI